VADMLFCRVVGGGALMNSGGHSGGLVRLLLLFEGSVMFAQGCSK
jgi:hypothetical protein